MNPYYIKKFNEVYKRITGDENNNYKILFKISVSISFIIFFTLLNYFLIPKKYWNLPASMNDPKIDKYSIFTIFYYVCATWFTVGYGDVSPGCNFGRLLSILNMIISFSIVLT